MAWTAAQQTKYLRGVYAGSITPFSLPEDLFEHTFEELIKEVDRGFVIKRAEIDPAAVREGFRKNVNQFSGAKTSSETIQLLKGVTNPDGTKRSFKEFKKIGQQIDELYNLTWLKTEQNTAFSQAVSADQWIRTDEMKDTFTMLQYQTVGDNRVRPEHRDFDGITKPVDSEFWDTRIPPNDFNCRCRVIRLQKAKETNLNEHKDKVNRARVGRGEKPVPNLANSSKVFNTNPAKTKKIFKISQTSYAADAANAGVKVGKNNYGLGFK